MKKSEKRNSLFGNW